ncbi:unnamed protein product [Rhodiola kirilowii]
MDRPPFQRIPQMLPPHQPISSDFWRTNNVKDRFQQLQESLLFAKAMKTELEMLATLMSQFPDNVSLEDSLCKLSSYIDENRLTCFTDHQTLFVQAANSLISNLRFQLEPFRVVADEAGPWEEKSVAVRLTNKLYKAKRNKQWRKRKRKCLAERREKEIEQFDHDDQAADEWRAREIANDIAKRKLEKMKEIAKQKAKEEKRQLESELELVLIVEKLQELRSLRIGKLKKQGRFLPEEDDKFLERVRAAVEEEERIAMVAAETDTAKEAIVTAEESWRLAHCSDPVINDDCNEGGTHKSQENEAENKTNPSPVIGEEPEAKGFEQSGANKSLGNLPMEFYHYYHGSSTDLGTLIEVRRTWDAYIRPGGSRIPGHWIEPPPPSNEVWASYLGDPK